ncbi:MAG: signal peptidase I [Clostridiales bacterium]|nr:signal peptidase I [Clostridiales bacterium]
MKYLKLLFTILSWPVYLCIAAYLLIAAPLVGGYKPVIVLSGSMEPTYHVGSIIYYKACSFEAINEGDPITFGSGEDSLVTHRVVEKHEISREFVTKGDANNTADPNPVPYSRVVGKASNISIPYAGYFVTYGRQPLVIGAMGMILVLGILFDRLAGDEKPPDVGKEDGTGGDGE